MRAFKEKVIELSKNFYIEDNWHQEKMVFVILHISIFIFVSVFLFVHIFLPLKRNDVQMYFCERGAI